MKDVKLSNALLCITEQCNLSCEHCYQSRKNYNLPLKTWMRIIDKLKIDFGIKKVVLLGGEPTLHPQFWSILQYAIDVFGIDSKSNPNVTVETNGTILGTNFSDYNCNVSISFENVDPKLNDDIRGTIEMNGENKSVFDVALWKLRSITNPRIMRFTLMQDLDVMKALVLAERCESNSVFIPLIPVGKGKELIDKVPDTTKLRDSMRQVYSFNEIAQYEHTVDHPFYYLANTDMYHKFSKKFVERGRVCQAAGPRIFISAKGNVHPCSFLTKYDFGDFLKRTKKSIYKEINKFNEMVSNITLKHKCLKCLYQNVCGACIASYIENGYKSGVNCPI